MLKYTKNIICIIIIFLFSPSVFSQLETPCYSSLDSILDFAKDSEEEYEFSQLTLMRIDSDFDPDVELRLFERFGSGRQLAIFIYLWREESFCQKGFVIDNTGIIESDKFDTQYTSEQNNLKLTVTQSENFESELSNLEYSLVTDEYGNSNWILN